MRVHRLPVLFIPVLCLVSRARVACAEDSPYLVEVEAFYLSTHSKGWEDRMVGGAADFYFSKVEPGEEPIAETEFVQRVSSAGISPVGYAAELETEATMMYPKTVEETAGSGIAGSITLAAPSSPVAFSMSYASLEADAEGHEWLGSQQGPSSGTEDSDRLSCRLVTYVSPHAALALEYATQEATMDRVTILSPGPLPTLQVLERQAKVTSFALSYRSLSERQGRGWRSLGYNVTRMRRRYEEAASWHSPGVTTQENDETSFDFSYTFYPNRQLGYSFGLGMNSYYEEPHGGVSTELGLSYNAGTRFGINVTVERYSGHFWEKLKKDEGFSGGGATDFAASLVVRF